MTTGEAGEDPKGTETVKDDTSKEEEATRDPPSKEADAIEVQPLKDTSGALEDEDTTRGTLLELAAKDVHVPYKRKRAARKVKVPTEKGPRRMTTGVLGEDPKGTETAKDDTSKEEEAARDPPPKEADATEVQPLQDTSGAHGDGSTCSRAGKEIAAKDVHVPYKRMQAVRKIKVSAEKGPRRTTTGVAGENPTTSKGTEGAKDNTSKEDEATRDPHPRRATHPRYNP